MARRNSRRATPVAALRAAGWALVAAVAVNLDWLPDPGLGLILGGTLAAYLFITRNG